MSKISELENLIGDVRFDMATGNTFFSIKALDKAEKELEALQDKVSILQDVVNSSPLELLEQWAEDVHLKDFSWHELTLMKSFAAWLQLRLASSLEQK